MIRLSRRSGCRICRSDLSLPKRPTVETGDGGLELVRGQAGRVAPADDGADARARHDVRPDADLLEGAHDADMRNARRPPSASPIRGRATSAAAALRSTENAIAAASDNRPGCPRLESPTFAAATRLAGALPCAFPDHGLRPTDRVKPMAQDRRFSAVGHHPKRQIGRAHV